MYICIYTYKYILIYQHIELRVKSEVACVCWQIFLHYFQSNSFIKSSSHFAFFLLQLLGLKSLASLAFMRIVSSEPTHGFGIINICIIHTYIYARPLESSAARRWKRQTKSIKNTITISDSIRFAGYFKPIARFVAGKFFFFLQPDYL